MLTTASSATRRVGDLSTASTMGNTRANSGARRYALSIVFSVFFFFFPAGLVLYWLINNILSIAQQWRITRVMEREAAQRKS